MRYSAGHNLCDNPRAAASLWRNFMTDLSRKALHLLLLVGCLAAAINAQTAAPQTPLTAEQYVTAGDNYARARQYDQAVDAYRQAIKLNSNLAAAYHGLGRVYVNMGRATD